MRFCHVIDEKHLALLCMSIWYMITMKNSSLEWKRTNKKAFVSDIMEKAPDSYSVLE
jgi:hypothetical protein